MLIPPELVSRKSAVQPSTVGSYSRKGMYVAPPTTPGSLLNEVDSAQRKGATTKIAQAISAAYLSTR